MNGIRKKSGSRDWDSVYKSVIDRYSETNQKIHDYKGGEIRISYIQDYFYVSLSRFRLVCDIVTSHLPSGSSILEVGPGYGFILLYLKERGYLVSGAELHENIQAYSRAMINEKIPVFPFNIESDKPKEENGQYDLIIASEVLEHLHISLSSSINKLTGMCKEGGLIFITVPNIYRVENYLKIICRDNICEDFPEQNDGNTGQFADLRTHPREPTMKDLVHAVKANDLEIIEKGYFSSSLKAKHPLLSLIIPPAFREHLFVLAVKRSEK